MFQQETLLNILSHMESSAAQNRSIFIILYALQTHRH